MQDGKPAVPTGTVTFVFSDIEGSTVRWDSHRDAMQAAVRKHDELMRRAIADHNGWTFKTIGDAFCVAFSNAGDALAATLAAQRAVAREDWSAVNGLRVRMAIHSGVADERDDDYFGPTVNRVARLLAIGHGGQVLVSGAGKALVQERLSEEMSLIDLGVHRLKDLSSPEQVYQLRAPDLATDFPPLRSLDYIPNNLPVQISPLVGREQEFGAVSSLIAGSRLVTLIGSGGVGKTRIALQVAADAARDDGSWFVDLASCADASVVPSAIASVFNIADEGGTRTLIDRVASSLKSKKLLLVLDNCEHVIHAAAEAVDRILQGCPDVRILATSREPLRISGEDVFRTPSLSVPPEGVAPIAAQLEQYGAVALFVARAHAAQRSFELTEQNAALVAEIVRRLEGIALAIELAAPRIKVLSLAQIAQRLDQHLKLLTGGSRTLPRQQTLRATIGWSYDLLGDVERSVFNQSAVFRGSFTLEAIESIWLGEEAGDVLDAVAALVDKSLFVVEGSADEIQRYRLLASTREFALERLNEAGISDATASRHCRYFAQIARQVGDEFWSSDADAWYSSVRMELENYRAAIRWALDADVDVAAAAIMVAALRWYWSAMARREGLDLIRRVTTSLSTEAPERVRGLAALTAGALTVGAGAEQSASESAALFARSGDAVLRTEALNVLAEIAGASGRVPEAAELAEEALHVARAVKIPRLLGTILSSVGYCALSAGDAERAAVCLDEAASILRRCSDLPGLAKVEFIRAELLFARGDAVGALGLVGEAKKIYRERGNEVWLCFALLNEAAYSLAAGEFSAAWSSAREASELALRRDDDFGFAVGIAHLALVAAENRDPTRAALLIGFADASYERLGSVRESTERTSRERLEELLRNALPESDVTVLMAKGAAMDRDEASEEAMAVTDPCE
jgi:predicted ATPase/class 3 adenylate cyclase